MILYRPSRFPQDRGAGRQDFFTEFADNSGHMPSFYEFFAGGGMARAGLGSAWTCLFANDFDAKKGAVYADHWGEDGLKVGDVAALELTDLPGKPDLAWASFPCQDLS